MYMKEYAPGILDKEHFPELPNIKEPTKWEYVLHHHVADKRGPHFDLRLGDVETGHGHSWALNTLPAPGEFSYAIHQPVHSLEYFDFKGHIPSGYGAGYVDIKHRDKIEILNSSPNHVSFNVYKSSGPEEYTLHKMGDKVWKLYNRTPTRQEYEIPTYKPKYREANINEIDKFMSTDYVASAKIDDAHNLFVFKKGKPIRIFSYRESKRSPTKLIDHTHKVEDLFNKESPKDLNDTIVRGGLYSIDPNTEKATSNPVLGGILNANVWKSRENQKTHGKLKAVIYDVVKYKGKNMENAPYVEKMKVIQDITRKVPEIEPPTFAHTKEEKEHLLKQIQKGNLPETTEGVVFWNLHKQEPATKAKFFKEHDVYVRGFFPAEGKYKDNAVGGFVYSHTEDGPIVGKCGTGLSDKLRRDMHKHPEKYKGLCAVISSQEKYKTEALRVPAFKNWHLDKSSPDQLKDIIY